MASTLRRVIVFIIAAHAIFPAMWVTSLVRHGPVSNDWLYFKKVGEHFVAGDWSRIYALGAAALDPEYVWAYPPFALYLVAPLAFLPDSAAYALLAGAEIAALIGSLWLLWRTVPVREGKVEWVLAVVLSAPALTTIVTGQNSGLLLLCISAAAALWSRGRATAACGLLGLLAIKPNWGIAFGLFAVVRGERRGALAMAATVVVLCASTIPLGPRIWVDFWSAIRANAAVLAGNDPYQLITLRGFLEGAFGRSDAVFLVWVACATVLVAFAIRAWRRNDTPLRHLGIGTLLAIAANPYASFYDALVLTVPATLWWSEWQRWPRRPWLLVGLLLAAAWGSEQWLYSWRLLVTDGGGWTPPFSLIGPVTAVWLVVAVRHPKQAQHIPAGHHGRFAARAAQ